MSQCAGSAGSRCCNFHYPGLLCPFESPAKPLSVPYTVTFGNALFQSLPLSDQLPHQIIHQVSPKSPFLALPGEIRNRIYRFTMVAARPFAVQLQWNRPLGAALLQVNKQVYDEASGIFYAENTFRFPEALFVGAPILPQLHTLYRVPIARLSMMRSVVLDVPVYSLPSNRRLCHQTLWNLRYLTEFLASVPKMRVQLRLGYVWGEQCRYLGPSEYLLTLAAAVRSLQAKGIEMDVHIKTHPRFMDKWVDFLTSPTEPQLPGQMVARGNLPVAFSAAEPTHFPSCQQIQQKI